MFTKRPKLVGLGGKRSTIKKRERAMKGAILLKKLNCQHELNG